MFLVAMGASAGGLQALKEFFKYKQSTNGESFVVIIHSLRTYESKLAEILSRVTPIECILISDRMRIEPDKVYVSPPSHAVSIVNEAFRLTERTDADKINHTVNHFFHSLADFAGPKAIGVIMSGTGT